VCPGHEFSTQYFYCSGGSGAVSTKCAPRHGTPNLYFLHPVRYVGQIVHSLGPSCKNVDAPFSRSGETGTDSTNSTLGHVTP
jgi:hypothetical protein